MLMVDDNGDGKLDRKVPVPMPIFHFLNLINSMDSKYYLLPEQQFGAHRVSGFATQTEKDARILLYSHNMADVQSRSDAEFEVSLDLSGCKWPSVKMTSYQIDKERNTCFEVARAVADRFDAEPPSYGQSRLVNGDEARKAERLSVLRPTQEESGLTPESNTLRLLLPLSANGANFTVLSPEMKNWIRK